MSVPVQRVSWFSLHFSHSLLMLNSLISFSVLWNVIFNPKLWHLVELIAVGEAFCWIHNTIKVTYMPRIQKSMTASFYEFISSLSDGQVVINVSINSLQHWTQQQHKTGAINSKPDVKQQPALLDIWKSKWVMDFLLSSKRGLNLSLKKKKENTQIWL